MNFLFRSFVVLGATAVLLLFAALIVPSFVDWRQYTDDFEEQASRMIGQSVKVGGETRLQLLPLPSISFEGLEVGENPDGSPMMTAERISIKAELLPFLSGDVRIVDMRLISPQIKLQITDNGVVSWAEPKTPLVDPEHIAIEALKVEGGSVIVDGWENGKTLRIENVQATIAATSVLGPWMIEGGSDIGGVPVSVKILTGTYNEQTDSMRAKVNVSSDNDPYHLVLDGPVSLDDSNELVWSGNFNLDPFSQNELDAKQYFSKPLDFHLEGKFKANTSKTEIPEFQLETGNRADPYIITGDGEFLYGERSFYRIQAKGRQFDLAQAIDQSEENTKLTLGDNISALRTTLEAIPVPNSQGEIKLSLPAIVSEDTFIRDVSTTLEPSATGWKISSLNAKLPGNTILEASGQLGLYDDFGFDGQLLIASRQPSGLAAWLAGDVSDNIRRLKSVGLDADVSLSERQLFLENMVLRLDSALLTGQIQRLESASGRPALIARISGNRINTQDLLGLYSLVLSPDDKLVSHDLDVEIQSELLDTKINDIDVLIHGMDTKFRMEEGNISLERFSASDVFGASITSRGIVENLFRGPNGNMHIGLKADNGLGVLDFLNQASGSHAVLETFLSDPDTVKDLKLEIELDTSTSEQLVTGQILVSGEMAGSSLMLRTGFDGDINTPSGMKLDLTGKFSNPKPSMLLRQAGIKTLPDGLASEPQGPLTFEYDAKGRTNEGFQLNLHLSAPNNVISANGVMRGVETGGLPDSNLSVTMGMADITEYTKLIGMQLPFPSDALLPVSARFNWDYQAERIAIDDLDGQIRNNKYSGNLIVRHSGPTRPVVNGTLKFEELDLGILSELALGRFDSLGLSSGLVDEANLKFTNPLYPDIDATIDLSANVIRMGTLVDGKNGSVQFNHLGGVVDLSDVEFETYAGKLTGSANIRNTSGVAVASGNLTLTNAEVAQILDGMGMTSALEGPMMANVTFEMSGQDFQNLVSSLTGNGFVSFEKLHFENFDPDNFSQILKEVNHQGFDITNERINQLLEDYIFKNHLDVNSVSAPFSIAGGKLKMRNITLVSPEHTKMTGELETNLSTGEIHAELEVQYDPGVREEISGADPVFQVYWQGVPGYLESSLDPSALERYFSLRAYEVSQRRIETLEASVIEKQRLQGMLEYSAQRKIFEERKVAAKLLRLEELERERTEFENKKKETAPMHDPTLQERVFKNLDRLLAD